MGTLWLVMGVGIMAAALFGLFGPKDVTYGDVMTQGLLYVICGALMMKLDKK